MPLFFFVDKVSAAKEKVYGVWGFCLVALFLRKNLRALALA